MADLTITPDNVGVGASSTQTAKVQMGEAITSGVTVYKDAADSDKLKIANSDPAVEATSDVYGITLDGGADDEFTTVVTKGPMRVGATVVVGTMYYCGIAAGGISTYTDVATADIVVQLGPAITSTVIDVNIKRLTDLAGAVVAKPA